jgi:hypothetical protein
MCGGADSSQHASIWPDSGGEADGRPAVFESSRATSVARELELTDVHCTTHTPGRQSHLSYPVVAACRVAIRPRPNVAWQTCGTPRNHPRRARGGVTVDRPVSVVPSPRSRHPVIRTTQRTLPGRRRDGTSGVPARRTDGSSPCPRAEPRLDEAASGGGAMEEGGRWQVCRPRRQGYVLPPPP